MPNFRALLRSGRAPTLLASFLCFDFAFAIWLLNGAMAAFIGESFHLTAAQKGFMVSVLIIACALMGLLSQCIGRKRAAITEMALIVLAATTTVFQMVVMAVLGVAARVMMPDMQMRRTRTWAEKGGRARTTRTAVSSFATAWHPATTGR